MSSWWCWRTRLATSPPPPLFRSEGLSRCCGPRSPTSSTSPPPALLPPLTTMPPLTATSRTCWTSTRQGHSCTASVAHSASNLACYACTWVLLSYTGSQQLLQCLAQKNAPRHARACIAMLNRCCYHATNGQAHLLQHACPVLPGIQAVIAMLDLCKWVRSYPCIDPFRLRCKNSAQDRSADEL